VTTPLQTGSLARSATSTDRFDFYGFNVEVMGDAAELVDEVGRDFAYFRVPVAVRPGLSLPDMMLKMNLEVPPYANLPPVPASVITPRNVCFREGDTTYIDYFGRGLAIVDRARRTCVMYAAEFDMAREMAYLFLLSTVGQYLDGRGMHRIHAMGVNCKGRGILLLLPSGGGKSTMTMELLKHPDFTLLSEDTPLIDRRGRMHPFPLRLGVRNPETSDIPKQYRHTLKRMEFEPKTFVDLEFFQHKLSEAVDPALILVGQRNLGQVSEIVPLPRARALKAVVKHLVVGLGVYQGLEFLLERGIWEMAGKGGVAASRLRNGVRLLSRAPAFEFVLGRDPERNARTLIEFVRRTCG
jgi:hypothetical protein